MGTLVLKYFPRLFDFSLYRRLLDVFLPRSDRTLRRAPRVCTCVHVHTRENKRERRNAECTPAVRLRRGRRAAGAGPHFWGWGLRPHRGTSPPARVGAEVPGCGQAQLLPESVGLRWGGWQAWGASARGAARTDVEARCGPDKARGVETLQLQPLCATVATAPHAMLWNGQRASCVYIFYYYIGLGLLHTQKRKSVYFTQISYLK